MDILKKLTNFNSTKNCYLFTNKNDFKYLTGIDSSNAWLLYFNKKYIIFTDSRYINKVKKSFGKRVYEFNKETIKDINSFLVNSQKLIVDSTMSIELFEKLKKNIQKDIEFKSYSDLRLIKSNDEIAKIKQAAKINDDIYNDLLKEKLENKTEIQVKNIIKQIAFSKGVEGFAFEPIVAFGKNSANPHWTSGTTKITKGPLLIDIGIIYNGYCSDMTRMVHIGKPNAEFLEKYNLLLKIQEAVINKIKPSFEIGKLDEFVREELKNNNLEHFFTHSLGHGLGIEVHEEPRVYKTNKDKLKNGMIITIEPGIYMNNKFGIRIEDLIQVTSKGYIILSKASKKLIQC